MPTEKSLQLLRPCQAEGPACQARMPKGTSWTNPKGGFYVWVTMPGKADSTAVFNEAIKRKAAFVIGSAFDPYGKKNNSFRLAFSNTPEDKIAEGIAIISSSIEHVLA